MKYTRLASIALLSSVIAASCVKKTYDIPPDSSKYDPHTPTNATIGDVSLQALMLPQGKSRILGDTTIYGIVIGDDRSGNIYKKIIIEDSAGSGISVILDKTYLYGDYPVGRKIYIKANGLYITNYKGVPELTYSVNVDGTTNGIPSVLISDFIVKASYPNTIAAKEITTTDLYSNPQKYVNTLVKLSNMQFEAGSANVPYSAATSSTNRVITNCDKTVKLLMYNSNYATFQPAITPNGNGSITGIITIYISTPEFTLRDTADVSFTSPRCP